MPDSRINARKRFRPYRFALLLVPVVALAVAIGYYKFFLPDGVAAIVNGETITLSELDREMARVPGLDSAQDARVRLQILNQMITRRVAYQEALKSGMRVSQEEAAAALVDARKASGLDEPAFNRAVAEQYGSLHDFQIDLERNLLIKKFVQAKIISKDATPAAANRQVSAWLEAISLRAAVRIALNEQRGGCPMSKCSAATAERSAEKKQ